MKRPITIYSRLKRLLCLVLALHFLNCSIDPRDPDPDSIPEDLSFNDIESVTEFVAEIVFGWTDAFAEHDEKDAEDGSSGDALKFYFSNDFIEINQANHRPASGAQFFLRDQSGIPFPAREVTSPPPKA